MNEAYAVVNAFELAALRAALATALDALASIEQRLVEDTMRLPYDPWEPCVQDLDVDF